EGWGIAVLEAASAGLPTLCRDVDGLRDSVRPGRTGWLMGQDVAMDSTADGGPNGSMNGPRNGPTNGPTNGSGDALDRALDDPAHPAAAARMGTECRAWAGRFDWAVTGQRMADLAAALLRGDRPGPGWASDHALAEAGRDT